MMITGHVPRGLCVENLTRSECSVPNDIRLRQYAWFETPMETEEISIDLKVLTKPTQVVSALFSIETAIRLYPKKAEEVVSILCASSAPAAGRIRKLLFWYLIRSSDADRDQRLLAAKAIWNKDQGELDEWITYADRTLLAAYSVSSSCGRNLYKSKN